LDENKEIIIEKFPLKLRMSDPIFADLDKRIKSIYRWLKFKFPTISFQIMHSYQPVKIESNCCSTIYTLGSLKIRKGLSKNRSFIGIREFSNHEQSKI
jgi:hypothetical protein